MVCSMAEMPRAGVRPEPCALTRFRVALLGTVTPDSKAQGKRGATDDFFWRSKEVVHAVAAIGGWTWRAPRVCTAHRRTLMPMKRS